MIRFLRNRTILVLGIISVGVIVGTIAARLVFLSPGSDSLLVLERTEIDLGELVVG
jgi:hypothetical protein